MKFQDMHNGRFYNEDTFEAMADIPDGVIDMLLVDLPYGTTACRWDTVLPFDKLWSEYNRVCKENAAMVFTASQPFTSALISSNLNNFKLELIWHKDKPSNFAVANRMPLKYHENICIFYKKQPTYNKQMEDRQGSGAARAKYTVDNSRRSSEHNNLKDKPKKFGEKRNPSSVQQFSTGQRQKLIHPTQKPVELFEYLIRTYTNEGDVVLDNTAGSGTTAIAAINLERKWCCIEQDDEYYAKAIERIEVHSVEK